LEEKFSWKRSFLGGEANSINDFFSWRRSFLGREVFLEEKLISDKIYLNFRILLFGLLVLSFNNLYSYFNHAL
jgi:hypothetical protein